MIEIMVKQNVAYLEEYPCDGSPKGAVVICPGGGYSFVSPREAEPVAKAYNRYGFHAFVLTYETKKEVLGDLPLRQLASAVKYVRDHRKEYDLDQKKIVVLGFSAGGHLAGSLGILWNRPEYFEEGADLQAHKPDGMILCYPVVTAGEAAHRGSMERLAGKDREKQERYSLEKLVDKTAVPAFIWGTVSDDAVPVDNSLLLLEKFTKVRRPVEYHLYPYGVHGLSLATEEVQELEEHRYPDPHVARWLEESVHWLEEVIIE